MSKCLTPHCDEEKIINKMCYKHYMLKTKLTLFYHKIGDPLINDDYNLLPNNDQLNSYRENEIKHLIYILWRKISDWEKCLYAREETSKLFPDKDKDIGHKIFINSIIKNINDIHTYLSNLYTYITKKDEIKIIKIENKDNYKNEKNNSQIKKSKKVKKINKNEIKICNIDYLDHVQEYIKYDLNSIQKYNDLILDIYSKNNALSNFFTENKCEENILILKNISYCVFIKSIFNKNNIKYIKLEYYVKNKKIKLTSNLLLIQDDINQELVNLQKFNDELYLWIERIKDIIIKVENICYMLYKAFIKNKCDNIFIENIDTFIQGYYKVLCIHINNGKVKNICLENRSHRIYKKELLLIEDIFLKIELINNSLIIPKTLDECICFIILNSLDNFYKNIPLKIYNNWLKCCKDNDIFQVCQCIEKNNLNSINFLNKILIFGCNIYIIKKGLNISPFSINDLLKDINFKKNEKMNIYLNNNEYNIEYIKYSDESSDIIFHYNCMN